MANVPKMIYKYRPPIKVYRGYAFEVNDSIK